MKKLLVGIVFVVFVLSTGIAQASTLDCSNVDGMAIFGYDGTEWVHIGAIGNEYSSLSIANEYGAGSEYKSTSIFNSYGKFGSEYSSYSAFNDLANKPPIIVDNNYHFVGYLTINDFKVPNINTYAAVACAKESFKSPNSQMVDVVFTNIPKSTTSSGGSTYTAPAITCPANSSAIGSQCFCNSGYQLDGTKSICVVTVNSSDSSYQNVKDHKIYSDVRATYAYNSKLSCVQLGFKGEDLAMCQAFSQDSNKEGWVTIERSSSTPNQPIAVSSADPIDLCIQKLGPHGVVNGQNTCGCSTGYVIDSNSSLCEIAPAPISIAAVSKTTVIPTVKKTNTETEPTPKIKVDINASSSLEVSSTTSLPQLPNNEITTKTAEQTQPKKISWIIRFFRMIWPFK